MPAVKFTMIFTYQSGITVAGQVPVRIGGWSENYYADNYDTATYNSFLTLIQKRLAICPLGTVVNKVRVQRVDPSGPASLTKVSFAAPATFISDVPQMALKVPFFLGTVSGQILREFRGLPDDQVTAGEFTPTAPFTNALNIFLAELINGTWKARRRDKTKPPYAILSIDNLGVVIMTDATSDTAQGVEVQVLRTINPLTGRRFGYFAKIQAFTDFQHFTLAGVKVKASNFGKLRIAGITYAAFKGPQADGYETVVRKIGRPSRAYSGRASKRQ